MPFSDVKIRQFMTQKITIVPSQTLVKNAAILMKENGVGSVLIGDKENIMGIVTETDLVHKIIAEERQLATTKVEAIMSFPILTIEADCFVPEAAETMIQNGVRHLAVTDSERVVGVISMRDLLNPIYQNQKRSEA